MTVSTEQPSVPAAPAAAGKPPRTLTAPFWVALVLTVASLGAGLFTAFTHRIEYFEFHPGSARAVSELISVDPAVETFPTVGDIAFTTVTLKRSTAWSYVLAWFDDDVELIDDELILGDRSPSENRQYNLQLMDTSKQDAVRSALVALGYEVPITLDGSIVVEIVPGSAAEGVIEPGETIVSIDGEPIDSAGDISRIMDGKPPGVTVALTLEALERTSTRTLEIVLGEDEANPAQGLIGVRLQPRNPAYAFPFDVQIESGAVGGPSAGLAFTLAVLDVLTPGDLTGGKRIAVTGTIDAFGNVGLVGGVRQKTAAVIDAGYDVFLVPSAEEAQAAQRAGTGVQVIGVDTLQQALDALASLGGSGLGSPPGNTEPAP